MSNKGFIIVFVIVFSIMIVSSNIVCANTNSIKKYEKTVLKKDLKKVEKINKILKKHTKKTNYTKKLVVKRNKIVNKNYKYMIKKGFYKKLSYKYGLDWEC